MSRYTTTRVRGLSEVLGLVWSEIDFDAGLVHVRKQLDRNGQRVALKSPAAVRGVVLMDGLASLLRGHRDAARELRPVPLDRERDFVFATLVGTPFGHRNVEVRGLGKAAERAGLIPAKPKRKKKPQPVPVTAEALDKRELRFHDLRHTFASLLIAQGADVVFVSRQLGHADPSITLRVYAHLFAAHVHADRTRALLQAAVGNVLETRGGERARTGPPVEGAEVALLHGSAATGD